MKWHAYFFIAARLAFSHKGSNLISSVVVTTLSLLPLVVTMEVADGMTKGIISRYLETSSYHFRVSPLAGIPSQQEIAQVEADLRENPNVISVMPERQSFAMAFSSFGREGVMLRGVNSNFYEADPRMRDFLAFSTGSPKLDMQTIAVGQSLAKKLNLQVGDMLRILTVAENSRTPVIRRFHVGGIFSVGYHELDKSWVLMDNQADIFLDQTRASQFFLGIKVRVPFHHVEAQKASLQALIPEDWLVMDWYNMNYATIENFRITTLMLLFVLGLIVCVAVINNTGALHIFFLSRRKEIVLLKAMGANPQDIRNIFLGLGFVAGLVGALLGIALGSLIAVNIDMIILGLESLSNLFDAIIYHQRGSLGSESFYLEKTHIDLSYPRLLLVAGMMVFWSTLVNYFPAHKVAHSKVLAILRKI